MSPATRQRLLDELGPKTSRGYTVVDARIVDNDTGYLGTTKAILVSIVHVVAHQPCTDFCAERGQWWSVRCLSIDRYTGNGASYDTLEEAQAAFQSHLDGLSDQRRLF